MEGEQDGLDKAIYLLEWTYNNEAVTYFSKQGTGDVSLMTESMFGSIQESRATTY